MRTLSVIVTTIWVALCDSFSYMPYQIGSDWLTRLEVKDGYIVCSDDSELEDGKLSVEEINYHNVSMIQTMGFDITKRELEWT